MVECDVESASGFCNGDFVFCHGASSLTITNSTVIVLCVKRDQYKTVTDFALLVPASEPDAMGEATFLSETECVRHVRALKLEEIKKTAKGLKRAEAEHFDALLALRDSLESMDGLARDNAVERMKRVYRRRESERPKYPPEVERILGETFASFSGLSPEETIKYMDGVRSGPKASASLQRLFSYEVSQAVGSLLHNAQIVLWWMEGAFRPAIYCPDIKTALYIHTFFLAPVGGVGFRICPYDGEQFFQDRPNQEYCCPAHREAHRVARFRDKKKRKAAESGKKVRESNGTKKAR